MKLSCKWMTAILVVMLFALPASAEMLDLSLLDEIEEAQMIEEPAVKNVWTYPISYDLLTSSEYIVLANKENLLDEKYVPEDLTEDLKCRKISYDPIRMRRTAAEALYSLFDAAEKDDIYLYAHSGYRSYKTQNTMYYNRLKKNKGVDDGYVAYPGSSDHLTGLGIDVIHKAGIGKKFTKAFGDTKHGKWLAENCWDYGFIIRYQEDKEEITQIEYEPWHLRYVGVQVAQYMRDQHLSLEEFTAEWKAAAAAYEAGY